MKKLPAALAMTLCAFSPRVFPVHPASAEPPVSAQTEEGIENALIAGYIEALKEGHGNGRMSAARALGKLGRQAIAALPPLINSLATDKNPGVRQKAAWALGRIAAKADRAAILALAVAVTRNDGLDSEYGSNFIRINAIEALETIGSRLPEVVRALARASVADLDIDVRMRAEAALKKLGLPSPQERADQ